MGSTRPHLRWASGLVAQESASERPASVTYNSRHLVLPWHGVCPPPTSNATADHGNPDVVTLSLPLMVDTCPIRLQWFIVHRGPNSEGTKPILDLAWIARDMKRINSRHP